MFNTPLNTKTVTVKIKRIELCDLMLACTACDEATESTNTKWSKLHDRLQEILDEFDSKQKI